MVKEGRTCLGLEFFVNEGDDMWTKPDADLIEQGKRELQHLGLVDEPSRSRPATSCGCRRRIPVYDEHYQENVDDHAQVDRRRARPNVYPCGRNGMHKYNNQDHSMFTAMLSVENILGAHHDVWTVNVEAEYHEDTADCRRSTASTGRDAAARHRAPVVVGASSAVVRPAERRDCAHPARGRAFPVFDGLRATGSRLRSSCTRR